MKIAVLSIVLALFLGVLSGAYIWVKLNQHIDEDLNLHAKKTNDQAELKSATKTQAEQPSVTSKKKCCHGRKD